MNDVRHAFRSFARFPGFSAVAVLSLAIGIGAGTAIFSWLNAILLRALPVRAPHELRVVEWIGLNPRLDYYTGSGLDKSAGRGFCIGSSFPYPAFQAFSAANSGLAAVFAFSPLPRVTAAARGEAFATSGLMVSGNYFPSYGATPLIGRPITAEDDQPGAAPVAVITYALWDRCFGLDPTVIGSTVTLNQHAFTVIGVLPRDYLGPLPGDLAEFYVTFAAQPLLAGKRSLAATDNWWVQMMARTATGVDERQAQAALTVAFRGVLAVSTSKMDQPGILLRAGAQGTGLVTRRRMMTPLLALLGVVGVVLTIACANVAGLLLARGATRQHEFAVRAALGASRWRLMRQSLTESLLLALAAGAIGVLLADWGKALLLQSFGPRPDSFRIDLHTDGTVLLFAFGVSLATALLFGVLPAIRAARVDPIEGLNRRRLAAPTQRIGKVLVAAQVGLSAVLVLGAALMTRTFASLVRVDPGFRSENVLLFRVAPGQLGYTGTPLQTFYATARRHVAALPGVRSVALSSLMLASGSATTDSFELPAGSDVPAGTHSASVMTASDGFFATLGIPIVLGREFTAGDTPASPPVVVVNETFARTFFPRQNPLGRTFTLTSDRSRVFTIVGVNRDAKYSGIREAIPPVMCFCAAQPPPPAMIFAIRSVLPPGSLVPAIRHVFAAIDSKVPLATIRTQQQLLEQSTAIDRLFAGLCGGLAGVALLLACIGLHGLMAYNVTRRTAEFGVRVALGATRRDLIWPVLREAFALTLAGLAVGLPAALALARLIRSQLYGVSPSDPFSIAAAALVLTAVALLAAWMPARRAAHVDAMVALRTE